MARYGATINSPNDPRAKALAQLGLLGGIADPKDVMSPRVQGNVFQNTIKNIGRGRAGNRRFSGDSGIKRGTGSVNRADYTDRTQGPSPLPAPSPLDQLLQMMQGLLGQQAPTYEPNLEDLMSQIQGQVDPVYDARKAAIESLMGRATERIGAGRQDVEGMYNALAQDYGVQAESAAEEMAKSQAESAALTGQLKKNIQGTYSRIAEEQGDLFQKLGIEEAAPEVLGEQASDQAFQESQAAQLGNLGEQYYNQLGASDQAYYQQGAPLAQLEGTNRSADLLSMLEDYMAESQSGLMELEGQRTSDINTAFNQLAMQAQQFAQQQNQGQGQQQWSRMMDMFGILQPMYGQQQQGPGLQSGAQQIAEGTGLNQIQTDKFYRAIEEIGSNPAVLYGQQQNPDTGEMVKTTLPAVINIIGNMQASDTVKQALQIWAEQAFGRR